MGNKIKEGNQHLLMFEGEGLTNPIKVTVDAAGSLEGETEMNAEIPISSNVRGDHYSERYGGMKMLGGAGGEGEKERGDQQMMQASVAEIFGARDEVEDERRLSAVKVPFLRELLATFHRISDLPQDISMEEERLYVGKLRTMEQCKRSRGCLWIFPTIQKEGTSPCRSSSMLGWRRTTVIF